MGIIRLFTLGVLIVFFQTLNLVSSEEPACVPGFKADVLTFIVERKRLQPQRVLGPVGFNDCTDRTIFPFVSSDNHFRVTLDGMLKVTRGFLLYNGQRNFTIHTHDSQSRKWTVPVVVQYRDVSHNHRKRHVHHLHGNGEAQRLGPHEDGPGNLHHDSGHGHHHSSNRNNQHDQEHHSHGSHHGNQQQHHSAEVATANKTEQDEAAAEETVLYFPKSTKGLKRRKRAWVIPPISYPENQRGPYPLYMNVQIRSDSDTEVKVQYSITGPGADKAPVGLFTCDRDSGKLFVTQPLDRETQAIYSLEAHAVVIGSGRAEEPMEIKVIVIDQNDNKPIFDKHTYLGEVAEASPIDFEVIRVNATDADDPNTDNADIRYSILSQDPLLPNPKEFEINPVTGVIRVNAAGLDREKYPKYTLEVQAADMRGNGYTAKAKVILTVTDSNDNAPKFELSTHTAKVPENKVGAQVVKMSVTDDDDPHSPAWNAVFTIVDGDPEGFFTVATGPNKQEGIISTVKGLDFEKNNKFTLMVAVENEVPFAVHLPTSTATVIVDVEDVNEAPEFNPPEKIVVKREDLAVGTDLVHYTAIDPDTARVQKVSYKIVKDLAGWLSVNKDTGMIKVKSEMDRESHFVKDNKYTALIGAYDNDEIPLTGTGTLVVQLEDVNDNAPTIDEREIKVCNKESAPQLLSVTDKDGPGFAAPYRVTLQGTSKSNWTARMNDTKTGIILTLATPLPSGEYTVVMRVGDNQNMEQDSTIQATVCECKGAEVFCPRVGSGAGFGLPHILGVLGAILLLLLLVLLLLMFLRRRGGEKKEPLLPEDDVRDNIYCYDEEGGGEDDQDYDLSVLHRGLDNRPEVFRNDVVPTFLPAPQYRARPANPEDIGNFIDDNLKAADNDPTAPPYDSLLVFDYEGGGSDAGSLSSLNSDSSGDQDYDCFNEWGPRFKKLADMYGGGEDDDML